MQKRYQQVMFLDDKIQRAIDLLQANEPDEGYFVAFSGGKDSVVILDLIKQAQVKYEAYYCNTTIDPPELRLFIRRYYPEVIWLQPKYTMFELIEKNRGMPLRNQRWCCRHLKEYAGTDRVVVTGIRAAESSSRRNRQQIEYDRNSSNKKFIHIIFDWTDADVWSYIYQNSLPYCSLYDEGFSRLGCIGCPMKSSETLKKEMIRYPYIFRKYKEVLQRAFNRKPSKYFGTDVETYFEWWLSKKSVKEWLQDKE